MRHTRWRDGGVLASPEGWKATPALLSATTRSGMVRPPCCPAPHCGAGHASADPRQPHFRRCAGGFRPVRDRPRRLDSRRRVRLLRAPPRHLLVGPAHQGVGQGRGGPVAVPKLVEGARRQAGPGLPVSRAVSAPTRPWPRRRTTPPCGRSRGRTQSSARYAPARVRRPYRHSEVTVPRSATPPVRGRRSRRRCWPAVHSTVPS